MSRAAVDAVAAWGETMPAKRTPNPTKAITTMAATLWVDTTVPRVMKPVPTKTSPP